MRRLRLRSRTATLIRLFFPSGTTSLQSLARFLRPYLKPVSGAGVGPPNSRRVSGRHGADSATLYWPRRSSGKTEQSTADKLPRGDFRFAYNFNASRRPEQLIRGPT